MTTGPSKHRLVPEPPLQGHLQMAKFGITKFEVENRLNSKQKKRRKQNKMGIDNNFNPGPFLQLGCSIFHCSTLSKGKTEIFSVKYFRKPGLIQVENVVNHLTNIIMPAKKFQVGEKLLFPFSVFGVKSLSPNKDYQIQLYERIVVQDTVIEYQIRLSSTYYYEPPFGIYKVSNGCCYSGKPRWKYIGRHHPMNLPKTQNVWSCQVGNRSRLAPTMIWPNLGL